MTEVPSPLLLTMPWDVALMFQSQSWIYRHICVLLIGMGEKEREEHCLIILRVRPGSCMHYFCSHLIDKNLIIQP